MAAPVTGVSGNRDFRLYWTARTVSIAGSQLARVVLTVFVYQLGGGAAGISVLLLAFTLPRLLGPLAGSIADRVDNKALMVGCDIAQALIFADLAWVRWWPGVVGMIIVATLFATLYLPAGRSSIPVMVGRDNLPKANAVLATGSNAALAVGPAVAGVMLTFGSPGPALLLNAGSFAISAALTTQVAGIRRRPAGGTQTSEAPAANTTARRPVTVVGAARSGLAVASRNPVARALLIVLVPSVGFASLDNAALIFLVRHAFHASAAAYGWVVTAFSIGMVGVPVLLSAARRQVSSRVLFFAGQSLYGAATIVTGLAPGLVYGAGAQVAAGGANGMENIGMDTLLAQSTPDAELGSVFGAVYTAPYAGQILAYLAAAPLIASLGARVTFVISGAGVLTAVAAVTLLLPARPAQQAAQP